MTQARPCQARPSQARSAISASQQVTRFLRQVTGFLQQFRISRTRQTGRNLATTCPESPQHFFTKVCMHACMHAHTRARPDAGPDLPMEPPPPNKPGTLVGYTLYVTNVHVQMQRTSPRRRGTPGFPGKLRLLACQGGPPHRCLGEPLGPTVRAEADGRALPLRPRGTLTPGGAPGRGGGGGRGRMEAVW